MPEASNGGVAIHYEVEGEGPPIVLHTGAAGDLNMWRRAGYVSGLAGFQLVLMDHRGHGRSGRPSDLSEHAIDRYIDDVLAVADAAGLDRFSFLGYSDGTAVGLALAARHSDRVDAVIGLGAAGTPDEWSAERTWLAGAARADGMTRLVQGLRSMESDLPDWYERQMLDTDPEMFALELEGWADWDGGWSELGRIRAPVLIVAGELEEGSEGEAETHAKEAVAGMPRGRAEILPGLGHVAVFTRSDLVLPIVRDFLREALGSQSVRRLGDR
jgi:pimeloyl-ACP methyl ester carboxylesterase